MLFLFGGLKNNYYLCFMREYKFKVGDIVIGNRLANQKYCYTIKGVKGKVVSVGSGKFRISVNSNQYDVDYDAFDLHTPHNAEINNYEIF